MRAFADALVPASSLEELKTRLLDAKGGAVGEVLEDVDAGARAVLVWPTVRPISIGSSPPTASRSSWPRWNTATPGEWSDGTRRGAGAKVTESAQARLRGHSTMPAACHRSRPRSTWSFAWRCACSRTASFRKACARLIVDKDRKPAMVAAAPRRCVRCPPSPLPRTTGGRRGIGAGAPRRTRLRLRPRRPIRRRPARWSGHRRRRSCGAHRAAGSHRSAGHGAWSGGCPT